MKKLSLLLLVSFLFLVYQPVLAKPDFVSVTLQTPGTNRTLYLPSQVDKTPVVYLGSASNQAGEVVEGYAFVHYKEGYAKPEKLPKPPKTSECYAYLARDAKWRNVESWVVNPTNTRGLSNDFIFGNLNGSIIKWENAAGIDILGIGSITSEILEADTFSPDNLNEVYFADVSTPNAIAVTIIWGVFGGPPANRRIIEWDQVYDDVDFDWSDHGESDKMDFENINTHELGHSVGMGDLYESACSEATMYGYASNGETKKRSLEDGDIAGVAKLY